MGKAYKAYRHTSFVCGLGYGAGIIIGIAEGVAICTGAAYAILYGIDAISSYICKAKKTDGEVVQFTEVKE